MTDRAEFYWTKKEALPNPFAQFLSYLRHSLVDALRVKTSMQQEIVALQTTSLTRTGTSSI